MQDEGLDKAISQELIVGEGRSWAHGSLIFSIIER